ncbi:MAG: amidophosphoribosyltransferase [Sulfolobales archaeon]|nr:amidophosphoribosyltransferase [Sulfolobales archaeon]MCX8209000.1 amidophosphoribosyltransferase [Sulfolobales archaeon]MDW8010881.1 amidophosphoribosyltransferase [Sulfolobales archaeon]
MCGISAYASGTPHSLAQAARNALLVLAELQHRGQESTGLAVADTGGSIYSARRGSLVHEALEDLLGLGGSVNREVFGCVAHTRYSTSGEYGASLAQPVVVGGERFKISIAFNGTIANYRELFSFARKTYAEELPSYVSNDTQALAYAIYALAKDEKWDVVEALKRLPEYVVGAYSLVALTSEPRLLISRDPRGFRPLAFFSGDREVYAASETSALQVFELEWREVGAGHVISFDGASLEITSSRVAVDPSPCVFEYVYFSRPDSYFNGVSIYEARIRMGEYLAREAPAPVDVVVPVPDSGRVAAIGYSLASGVPLVEGIVANKYVGRVFISTPRNRDTLSKIKYGVVRSAIEKKRIVVVDDSIVRGTTMGFLISKLRRSGAEGVHVRIASPPFVCPCFMGIDIASRKELLAWGRSSAENIRDSIGADSLAYNSLKALRRSVDLPRVCHACFSCQYDFPGLSVCELEKMFSR